MDKRLPEAMSRRALLLIGAGAGLLAVALGIRHGFGLFLQPMSGDNGWGREVFALAIAAQNLIWGAAQPFTGMLADQFGASKAIVAGAVLYAAGLVAMAFAQTPGELVFSAGLLVGLGLSGTTFAVVLGAVSRAVPPARRSHAMGVATALGSFGQFAMLPGSLSLIAWVGWSAALVVLACIAATMAPLAGAFREIQPGPATQPPPAARAALREALAHRGFWLLSFGFFVCGFHVVFITTHLPAFLVDRGLPLATGTTVLALIGLANVAGAYLGGRCGERFRKPAVLTAIYLGRAAAIGAFVWLPITAWSAYAFAVVIGLLWMSTVPLTNGTVASVFGVRNMSMLGGVVFFCHQIGAFLGGWLGGRLYDQSGSYDAVWTMAIGLALLAALLNWPIREQPLPQGAVQRT
jgi:predicted MFS family arabinose efflux permease